MFPLTTRSDDRLDAAGFGLGALVGAGDAGAALLGFGAPAGAGALPLPAGFGAGSLILLLENISCSLDIDHGVNGFAIDVDFVVKVGAC